jgi:hypothetical protein
MVEIIPKPIKKAPRWENFLFYISLAVLAVVISAFLILNHYETKAAETLEDLKDKIAAVGGSEAKVLEVKVFAERKKINDFANLIAHHQKSSNFFQFLETVTHPQVQFFELALDIRSSQAIISGKAPNFQILGQQLLIFNANDSIDKAEVSELGINKEGDAEFSLILYLSPEIFQ